MLISYFYSHSVTTTSRDRANVTKNNHDHYCTLTVAVKPATAPNQQPELLTFGDLSSQGGWHAVDRQYISRRCAPQRLEIRRTAAALHLSGPGGSNGSSRREGSNPDLYICHVLLLLISKTYACLLGIDVLLDIDERLTEK